MAETPKHKLLFGIPYGRGRVNNVIDPDQGLQELPTVLPCFTFDTSKNVFSSGGLGFDCDYNAEFLFAREQAQSGFTFDNNVVTMDTTLKIYN